MVFNATYNNISVILWRDKIYVLYESKYIFSAFDNIYVLYESKYIFSAVDILLQSNPHP